jgi:hypothetical protein
MPYALNVAAPLKQDPESQQKVKELVDNFAATGQPLLDAALAQSEIVHFARVVLIDDKYMMVITEFDGEPSQYAEFFRTTLGPLFQSVFSLVEGAPSWEELNEPNTFFEYMETLDRPSVGTSKDTNDGRGYLFSAYGDMTVREIKSHLPQAASASN